MSKTTLPQLIIDIISQSTRKNRASNLKRYLITDLEIIERRAELAYELLDEYAEQEARRAAKAAWIDSDKNRILAESGKLHETQTFNKWWKFSWLKQQKGEG